MQSPCPPFKRFIYIGKNASGLHVFVGPKGEIKTMENLNIFKAKRTVAIPHAQPVEDSNTL